MRRGVQSGGRELSNTNGNKLSAISREIALRRRVYPRQIENGRLTQEKADREIAIFEAIVDDYTKIVAAETQRERLL